MNKTNRHWMPAYCQPDRFLPRIQDTSLIFAQRPFLFSDFVARALTYLRGDEPRKMGFNFDEAHLLPCRWKCSDESLFHVDLALFAYTGFYPFDKGRIGGIFNEGAVQAALHHGALNLDFGGSHVGYTPGEGGGRFGEIWRPQERCTSTDCGYLCHLIEPFMDVYNDAIREITVFSTEYGSVMINIPNEHVQPNWCSHRIKLLVDLETLTSGEVPFREGLPRSLSTVGRTLFYLHPDFLAGLSDQDARVLTSSEPTPIGSHLTPEYFTIFDTEVELTSSGIPVKRLLVYMDEIVAATRCPPQLKAALVNTHLEHNRLSDCLRAPQHRDYTFASFSGIFVDIFDEKTGPYRNLFVPLALTIKPSGTTRQIDMEAAEVHRCLRAVTPAQPRVDMGQALGEGDADRLVDLFTYRPGWFRR